MFADFCTNEIRPQGEHIDQAEEPPVDLLQKAVDQGFWAALVPEERDGCDRCFVQSALPSPQDAIDHFEVGPAACFDDVYESASSFAMPSFPMA